jgi:4-phytase/acid phosphatase
MLPTRHHAMSYQGKTMRFNLLSVTCLLILLPHPVHAQGTAANTNIRSTEPNDSELRYVVYLSRHGVRSPTSKADLYNHYSISPWPGWPVQPGYLTPHGFHLMELFGAFDRAQLATQGLLSANGCSDASHVTIYADSGQRTRQTGQAIAQGLMPGCDLPVQSLPEGTNDPLFHPVAHPASNASATQDAALAKAAIGGRIGGDPANLTRAYYPQIAALDHILATCGNAPASASEPSQRTSLMDIPATLSEGNGDHLADLKGPLSTSATLSENLLLEYAEGMDEANVGWGCVHRSEVQAFLALHSASVDLSQRTPQIARAQASNLLDSIRLSIQQVANQKALRGAIGKPSDRALFLIGHDTNQENIAGLLNLTWMIDGRRDDTPPGGALMFELWRNRSSGQYSVRTYFTAQTLEQMRMSTPLTASNPPEKVPLFIPGCSLADMSCPLASFLRILEQSSKPAVAPKRERP